MLKLNLHSVETFEVTATYEGKNKDYTDLEAYISGEGFSLKALIKDVPFFDTDEKEISYEEALDLYGEDALEEDLWSIDNYLSFIIYHACKGDYTITTDKEVTIK